MPGERKPSFAVVSGVVATLGVFGFLTRMLEPAIPPIEANAMAGEPAHFLRQGAAQRIEWQSVNSDTDPFSAARSKNLPLMLVVGMPSSRIGRDLDEFAFTTNDVAAYLKRNFISVRVDATELPEWMNAYLPVARGELGFVPDLQIWFLDPEGKLFDLYVHATGDMKADPQAFLAMLVDVRRRYEGHLPEGEGITPSALQERDAMSIRSPAGLSLPSLRNHVIALERAIDPTNGGFPRHRMQKLMPNAWSFLLLSGQTGALSASLDPVLNTGIVDHLDGGFFHLSATPDWKQIEFDKVATQQAEMMHLLAMGGSLNADPYYKWLAQRAFDSLAGEFMDNGYVRACRIGDEGRFGRSLRSSFPVGTLRDLGWEGKFVDDDQQFARDVLGLKVEANPQMVVRLSDWTQAGTDRFNRVIQVLRDKAAAREPEFAGDALLDVNGQVAARMIQCARLWNDKDRLRQALELADRLEEFRGGDDVRHSVAAGRGDYAYLGDYLAYSDAKLQDFLATARSSSLENGLSVLRRAMVLFRGEKPGLYNVALGATGGRVFLPEIADNFAESQTARIIRLLDAYGRLILDAEQPALSAELRNAARQAAKQINSAAKLAEPYASGYFAAVLRLINEPYAVAVGPDSIELANELYRRLPTRLVSAAAADVRPDLQQRAPGLYILDKTSAQGPLTVEEAAIALGPFYSLD